MCKKRIRSRNYKNNATQPAFRINNFHSPYPIHIRLPYYRQPSPPCKYPHRRMMHEMSGGSAALHFFIILSISRRSSRSFID